ncbi:MAG: hypothetical protein H6735_18005 [Alphaproteobacteria bacterium]|nr:hypothetical protein [Alphaproteobacteria bacterium]
MAAVPTPRLTDAVSIPGMTGLAVVLVCAASADLLHVAGLAPLALAAVVAAFVGIPAAGAEWRGPSEEPVGVGIVRRSLAELAGLGLLASATASLAQPPPDAPPASSWGAVALALGVWPAGAVLGRRPWLAIGILAAMVAGAGIWAATSVSLTPPWTLLEPHPEVWRRFAPRAVVLGALAAGAGLGPLATRTRPPGQWRAPWATAGLTIAVATIVALAQGAVWESSLGAGSLALPAALVSLVLVAGAMALGAGRGRLIAGLMATLWLLGPGEGAAGFVLDTLVPMGAAASLALAAWGSRGADRWWTALGAGVLTAAVAAGGTPPPRAVGEGVAIGLLLVGAFWVVATRAVLARRTA